MIQHLEYAMPMLERTKARTLANIVHTHLLSGHSALIACSALELGLMARYLCKHTDKHGCNESLTITEGETTVIIQTEIKTNTP